MLPASLVDQLEPLRARLHAARNAVLPIVGSGLSRGLPSWTKLLEQLIAQVERAEDRDALTDDLAKEKYLEVAADLERLAHRTRVSTAIQRAYQRPTASRPPTYDRVAALPVTHFATTNYDPWLKDAVAARLGQAPQVYMPKDPGAFVSLAPDSPPMVLMLHGDADRPETCVLSEAGYRQFTHFPAYRQAMAALVATRSLLFIGHSLADPDLRLVLDEWQEIFGAGGAARRLCLQNPRCLSNPAAA
jgi:SIR2-like domain